MNVLDLYSGAGGFSLGFQQAGYNIACGVDIDSLAVQVFRYNLKASILCGDLMKLPVSLLPKTDVVIGSPPCQSWSNANNGRVTGPKDDPTLINRFMEIVEALKPRFWVMEEVPRTAKIVKAPYTAILDAWDFGVGQRRKRLFASNFPLPTPPMIHVTPREILGHGEKVGITSHAWRWHGKVEVTSRVKTFSYQERNDPSEWTLDNPFPTILCRPAYQVDGHWLTPEENALLQGFPSDFRFLGRGGDRYQLVGNAVCPPVAKAIAEAIREQT